MTHQEREVVNSRHSFFRSAFHGLLREGKKDLLEIRRQSVASTLARQVGENIKSAFGNDATTAQEHESVANFCRIRNLVNGQEECAIRRNVPSQCSGSFAALA